MENIDISETKLLSNFLYSRFLFPIRSIAFILYFFTIIVTVGFIAAFIGSFETIDTTKNVDLHSISIALTGYSLVLLCSSAIEFIFITFKDDEEKYSSLKQPIIMIGVTEIILGLSLSALVYWIRIEWLQFIISIVMTIITWFFWWISNARTLSVISNHHPPTLSSTTGGDQSIQGKINSDYTY